MLEEQQARLIKALRRVEGATVSYSELRASGVDLPATVVSELELAGVPIERCHGAGGAVMGVRLDPERDPARSRPAEPARQEMTKRPEMAPRRAHEPPQAAPRLESAQAGLAVLAEGVESALARLAPARRRSADALRHSGSTLQHSASGLWRSVSALRPSISTGQRAEHAPRRLPSTDRRWLAPVAVVATMAAALVLILAGLTSGAGGVRRARRHHAARPAASLAARPVVRTPATSTQASQPPSTPVSTALATQLESQGHGLLEAGQYAGAVPVLRRALSATGESPGGCIQPVSQSCLIYAYALYDLGRALRLDGQVAAALPILEQRLQIDNQRGTVQAELALAESEAGSSNGAIGATG